MQSTCSSAWRGAVRILVEVRKGIRIRGTVQGVGFRPFLHRLASELGLSGRVFNDADGVWCEIQGKAEAIDQFEERLRAEGPPLAVINELTTTELETEADDQRFVIESSPGLATGATLSVPADIAPCEACRSELFDPDNRRHNYPFICCTDCGPRFTVVDGTPYDRLRTTMAGFPLCAACEAEYLDPGDRRHHAQATCCGACGPRLWLKIDGELIRIDTANTAVVATAEAILAGRIVALKGVGGYQLLCRADDNDVVAALRRAKHRDEKPFALMVADLSAAERLVVLTDLDRRALTDPAAPIVLAPRTPGTSAIVATAVAPDTDLLGVMLPASPIHLLLSRAVGSIPLVCTSGNLSDEPIVVDDNRVEAELGAIAPVILGHNRPISRRADDSVGRTIDGSFQVLRRARGFAPRPVRLPPQLDDGPVVLAVGAELKNTVALAVGGNAVLSVHIGDLDNPRAITDFERTVLDLVDMVGQAPDLVAHDLHPEYLSTKFALAADLAPTVGVQHHHAHLASCLTDNGLGGETVLGVTFDGLGWGPDRSLWGGEFLVGNAASFERVAHLRPTPMLGGEAAVRQPWRMALAHVTGSEMETEGLALLGDNVVNAEAIDPLMAQLKSAPAASPSVPMTTSMGRLFDAVAALCGVSAGGRVAYEGQAAIQLEQLALLAVNDEQASARRIRYPVVFGPTVEQIDPGVMLACIVSDLTNNTAPETVAHRFHQWVADVIATVATDTRFNGHSAVALTGGVFQNRLLTELTATQLRANDLTVLTHHQVPPNDGGIALGQLAVARAQAQHGG